MPNTVAPDSANAAPIVVVGTGPVGVRFVQELHRQHPGLAVVVYGNEPWQPYNRVQLSSFLAGETDWSALTRGLELPVSPQVEIRLNCEVLQIDRIKQCVLDSQGRSQAYSRLILAIGSRPRIPDVRGIGQANVYVFRDMSDAERLVARRLRSRRTVVLGGGLLGLEAARAMRRFNTDVWVVEHSQRLMMNQLDEGAAELLRRHVEASGIRVLLDERVKCVNGEGRVTGVSLRNGRLDCDTVIIAAGVQPNTLLAVQSGLNVRRGIRVTDQMRTSDPDIYAIGECAEHRDAVYGLVAPGLEQAMVAVHSVLGGTADYTGSLVATQLKVLDLPVFSMGRVSERDRLDLAVTASYRDDKNGIYRKVVVERGRLIGAMAVGPCADMHRLQEAITHERMLFPWQLPRFRRTGSLWPEQEAESVVLWPPQAIVCNCNNVSRGQLQEALASGCKTVEQLAACTRASTVCGSCKPLLAELAGSSADSAPARAATPLNASALAALVFALLMLIAPAIPYADTVQLPWHWDVLWRDGLYKQISGFSVLGLSLLGLLLTIRKRWSKAAFGDFALWRVAHVVLGVSALTALYVHTGGRLGDNLNLLLNLLFIGLILAGGISSVVIAREHALPPLMARRWRAKGLWLHILLFWPVPILLGIHVLKSYYF